MNTRHLRSTSEDDSKFKYTIGEKVFAMSSSNQYYLGKVKQQTMKETGLKKKRCANIHFKGFKGSEWVCESLIMRRHELEPLLQARNAEVAPAGQCDSSDDDDLIELLAYQKRYKRRRRSIEGSVQGSTKGEKSHKKRREYSGHQSQYKGKTIGSSPESSTQNNMTSSVSDSDNTSTGDETTQRDDSYSQDTTRANDIADDIKHITQSLTSLALILQKILPKKRGGTVETNSKLRKNMAAPNSCIHCTDNQLILLAEAAEDARAMADYGPVNVQVPKEGTMERFDFGPVSIIHKRSNSDVAACRVWKISRDGKLEVCHFNDQNILEVNDNFLVHFPSVMGGAACSLHMTSEGRPAG